MKKETDTPKNASAKPTQPIQKKEDVKKSNDEHIDQDFKGFPAAPSKENVISPKSKDERLAAGVDKNAEEKKYPKKKDKKEEVDETNSDGSAGAFSATEEIPEEFFVHDEDRKKKDTAY